MNKPTKFLIITFGLSWLLWSGAVVNSHFFDLPEVFLLLSMFASFIPSLIGIIYLVKEKRLKSIFSSFRVTPLLVGVYLFLPVTAMITTLILGVSFKVEISTFIVSFFIMMIIGGAIGEEFGWRGFLLPKLFERNGVLSGTLILGVVWSLWHLPLFFIDGTVQSNLPMWQFMLQNTLLAFFYSYIYIKTKGNIIMAILFHTVGNWTSFIFPTFATTEGRFLNFGFLLLGMVLITIIDKKWYEKTDASLGD
jgi:membrane protease YdiL (CAAX protease family)